MSIQLGVGPHSASSLIRSDSSFQVDSINLNNITSTNSINSNLLNITNINLQNDLNISGNINANSTDLTITNGSVNLINTNLILDSNSDFSLAGNFNINNLNVTNQISGGNLNISNNTILSNDVIIGGDLTVNGTNLYVNNNKVGINTTSPTQALEVAGSSKINNNLEVRGSMIIGGEDNFNNTNFEDYSKWGSGNDIQTQIYSKYEYVGIGTQNPQYFLDVSGIINSKDRYFINGNEVLSENELKLSVTSSNLQSVGLLNSLNVTGQSNFNNNLNITSDLNILGNMNTTGLINISGNMNITGDIDLNGNLMIDETFRLNGTKLDITENTNIYNSTFKISNLIENTTKKLPPSRLNNNIQSISSFYGDGTYELTTSSSLNSLLLYQCMDQYTDTFFRSDYKYDSVTGIYTGTEDFNNLGILGEWIKIKLPQSFVLKSMVIKVLNLFIDGKNPKDIYIYASNDDISWTHVQTFQNLLWDINAEIYSFQNFSITNINSYQYYTFIIPKVGGKDLSGSYINAESFAITELELYYSIDEYTNINLYSKDDYIGIGTTDPNHTLDVKGNLNINGKFLIEDNEIFDTNLVSNLREYPPLNLTINSLKMNTSSETIELGTININDTLYAPGNYELYYTGFSPFFFPNSIGSNLFNKITTQNIYYRTTDTYDGLTGNYIGNNSLSGYNGEYIIIKLPVNILIKAFRIYNNLYDSEYFSPRNYKILGSLNKVNWDLIYEKDNEYFNPNTYDFVENNVYTDSLYNYFALVVTRVGNFDQSYTYTLQRPLKIQEFKIYGTEFNEYGINYNTGLYINGPLKVNDDLDVIGNINLNNVNIVNINISENLNSKNAIINNSIVLGTTNAINGKLEISGDYGNVNLGSHIKMGVTEVGLGNAGTYSYSLYADGKVAASEFNAISDNRVKNILSDRNYEDDKKFIEEVNIYNFEYIDKLNYGNKEKIGFMAQDLERLNNNLINYSTNFIPNVFKKFKIINKNKIILDTDYDIQINDILKIEINDKKIIHKKILEKKQNFIIIEKIENLFSNIIFIYGKKVTDFKTINFEQLIAINMNSIKNLYNEIKEIKENQKNILNHLNINT